MMDYKTFLDKKTQVGGACGFDPTFMPEYLFPFQKKCVGWSLWKGRSAQFQDCGLGKTIQSLVWAQNVVEHTNGRVLIVTPLAVSRQTIREGEKFGIEAKQSRDGKPKGKLTVTNYEKLHLFDPKDFIGFIGDESSILKNFDGKVKSLVIKFIRKMQYRLLCTATAAPNDFPELGNHSEALGELGFMDMLGRFFKNDNNTADIKRKWRKTGGPPPKFRFIKHAEPIFWRWVSSWAMAIRKPSDIGFDDNGFVLPDLIERQVEVGESIPPEGKMFAEDIIGMFEQRKELRRTLNLRCEKVAELLDHDEPAVAWGHLNMECDLMEKLIPGAVQVHGRMSDEEKEEKLSAFSDGQIKKLVTKGSIAGFGMNWQHCAHQIVFPWHSFEEYYQQVRRSWRFGQKKPVRVDIVTTPGLSYVLGNLKRKAQDAEIMFSELIKHMNNSINIERAKDLCDEGSLPAWIATTN
jgi:hypothetical protein